MRNVPDPILYVLNNLKEFTYCFEITLISNNKIFLTSRSETLNVDKNVFKPDSGLNIEEIVFNDSAQDYIILTGIYEEGGINKGMDLTGSEVKIIIYANNLLYNFVTFYCTEYSRYDSNFKILLQPITIKYNQTLLKVLSKTCRTNFGDTRCKVDKKLYYIEYEIEEIISRKIIVTSIEKENGYYTGGDAILNQGEFVAKILSMNGTNIILDKIVPINFSNCKKVILVPGCDKKFITCCNKFDNAVNFRGEPLIPEYNFLEVI